MYSSIHSLPLDGSAGGHENYGGSLDGSNLLGDGCLVLTTDPKPRLRWTAELHDRFVDAVTQLGGPDSEYYFFTCLLKKYWLCSSEACIFVVSGILCWSELLFGYWVFVLLTIAAFNVSHLFCVSLLR